VLAISLDDDSGVDGLTRTADGLKVQLVAGQLHQDEVTVLVVARGHDVRRPPNVSLAQRAAPTRNEIRDPALWDEALVEMLVAGEHDVDITLDEHRLEHGAKTSCSARVAA
jgi:hypothetical protein